MAEGLLRGQEYLHSLGITAWQDALVGELEALPIADGELDAGVARRSTGCCSAHPVAAGLIGARPRSAEGCLDAWELAWHSAGVVLKTPNSQRPTPKKPQNQQTATGD